MMTTAITLLNGQFGHAATESVAGRSGENRLVQVKFLSTTEMHGESQRTRKLLHPKLGATYPQILKIMCYHVVSPIIKIQADLSKRYDCATPRYPDVILPV